ncbi:AraC family transcriptional regulator [Aquabacterium sp.]|uniref:AraC family transcriptional regulator n=1 Tax=Aquabacterium sp. TaxID=1872578 RepID=UPI004038240B
MSPQALQRERSLSIMAVADLLSWQAERGQLPQDMLRGTGITLDELHDPNACITPLQEQAFFRNWLARDGRPHLGLYIGARYRLMHFGHLGLIVPHAATRRQAIELFLRFINLSYTHLSPEVDFSTGTLTLRGGEHLGDLRRFYLDRDAAFAIGLVKVFFPDAHAPLLRVRFDYTPQDPGEARLYEAELGAPVSFGAPLTQVQFDPSSLDEPMPEANALLVQMLEPQCEAREAAILPSSPVTWAQRVREALSRHGDDGPWPDAADIAERLRCSKRTLRRHLADEGVNFQDLSDAERAQRAQHWLVHTDHDLADIAAALGYSEPAALIRAYKRWFGHTPRHIHGGTHTHIPGHPPGPKPPA